jgi:hypothetical protein
LKPGLGAQFEILIGGVPRSYRDIRELALKGAELLKAKNPHAEVAVHNLGTGEKVIIK